MTIMAAMFMMTKLSRHDAGVSARPLYLLHISPKNICTPLQYDRKNPHTDFGKCLIKFKGSRLWINLPDSVKIMNSIPAFKHSL